MIADAERDRLKRLTHEKWEALGVCGCGHPEDVQAWMARALAALEIGKERTIKSIYQAFGLSEGQDVQYQALIAWFDSQKLVEHGSSIFGAWLSEEGKDFVKGLTMFTRDEIIEVPDVDT